MICFNQGKKGSRQWLSVEKRKKRKKQKKEEEEDKLNLIEHCALLN
tara:strand:+ start:113 stop:250 length:138 start_codon:yes stop_codon:yes gene_type:complete